MGADDCEGSEEFEVVFAIAGVLLTIWFPSAEADETDFSDGSVAMIECDVQWWYREKEEREEKFKGLNIVKKKNLLNYCY